MNRSPTFYINVTGIFNFVTHVIQSRPIYVHVQTNYIYNCLYFFSIMYYTTHLYTESETYMIKH